MARQQEDLIVMAVILGAHGVRGAVRVKSLSEIPEDALAFGPLLATDGRVLITPQKARPTKGHFIVTPKEFRQKEEWDGMKGTLLHIPRAALPEIEDGEVYVEDLVGLAVISPEGEALGSVKAVLDFGAGDLIEIVPADGAKPVLVPFTEVDVPGVDLAGGQIIVATLEIWADQSGTPDDA